VQQRGLQHVSSAVRQWPTREPSVPAQVDLFWLRFPMRDTLEHVRFADER